MKSTGELDLLLSPEDGLPLLLKTDTVTGMQLSVLTAASIFHP